MAAWNFPPFTRFLGLKILQHSPERTEAELVVREDLLNCRGVIQAHLLQCELPID
jgi:acyl-coenzyme A thioesterase PaaI-like protein